MGNHHHDHHNHIRHEQHSVLKVPKEPSTSVTQKQRQVSHYGGHAVINHQENIIMQDYQILEYEEAYLRSLLEKRKKLEHPNFASVKKFEFINVQDKFPGLCAPGPKTLRLTFDYIPSDLCTLIKAYCKEERPIEEAKIRKLFRQVVECLVYLQKNQTFHGDIKPSTIGLYQKQVKLLDSCLLQKGRSAFEVVIEDSKSESFLTPQQLQITKKRSYDSLTQTYQAEVFCVGMSMIEAMTFQASLEAYDLENLEFKPQFFKRKLQEMQEYGYTYQLSDLALKCVHKNPEKRPTFDFLLNSL